jgi:two-component system, NarL family, response regulator LiaR
MTTRPPIRVLIADDHAMVRSGLAGFLLASDDLELVGEASNGSEAVRACAETRPEVVLMDLMMPGMDGVTAIRAIHEAYPDIRVIALTSFPEQDMVQRALGAGAISYLLKNVGADELAGAIRGASVGRPTLAPEAAEALRSQATEPPEGHNLTQSEPDQQGLVEPMTAGENVENASESR